MTVLLPLPASTSASGSRRRATEQPHRDTGGFGDVPKDVERGLVRVGIAIRDAKRVVVIAGAGISTPAIPDFRSSTGLFKTLRTTAAEDLGRTRLRSRVRVEETSLRGSGMGAAGIRSGKDLFDVKCLSSPTLLPHHHALLTSLHRLSSATQPTAFHHLLKMLDTESRLLRVYTQNIDGLEGKVGLDCRVPDLPVRKVPSKRRKDASRRAESSRALGGQASLVSLAETACEFELNAWQPAANTLWRTRDAQQRARLARIYREGPQVDIEAPACELIGADDDIDAIDAAMFVEEPSSRRVDYAMQDAAALSPTPGHVGGPDSHSCTSASDWAERRSVGYSTASEQGKAVEAALEAPTASQTTTEMSLSQAYGTRSPSPEADGGESSRPAAPAPRCVPLHGLLDDLHCTLCSHSVPLESQLPLPADVIPCPSCQSHQEARMEMSVRARSVGTMRAGVVLYGEEHRHGEAIGAVVEKDIKGNKDDGKIDLLIVAGTTLHIPGVKRMIKEFSRVLRRKPLPKMAKSRRRTLGGDDGANEDEAEDDDDDPDFPIRTVFLNMDPPGKGKGGEWADIFDVWVQGDLQTFVEEWVNKPRDLGPVASARTPTRPSKRASGPITPRLVKKQISLSEPISIAVPTTPPNPFVTKTGNLKFMIKKPSPEGVPSSSRKCGPETPPTSKRGRAIKPSAKLASLKKRKLQDGRSDIRHELKAVDKPGSHVLQGLIRAGKPGPQVLEGLITAGKQAADRTAPRRPRKSISSARYPHREETPCPTSDASSDLSELPPSPSPSPMASPLLAAVPYAYSSPTREQRGQGSRRDTSPLTSLDGDKVANEQDPAVDQMTDEGDAEPSTSGSPTLSDQRMSISSLLNPEPRGPTRAVISLSALDETRGWRTSAQPAATQDLPNGPCFEDPSPPLPTPYLAAPTTPAPVTSFFASSKMGSSPLGKASWPTRRGSRRPVVAIGA